MTLKEVCNVLNANALVGEEHLEREVFCACGSDLMSDVLAYVKDKVVLLTGLVNPQVVRTAEMMDIKAIVFVRGKIPSEDVIKLATLKDMVIISTADTLFTACGLLYQEGLRGKGELS